MTGAADDQAVVAICALIGDVLDVLDVAADEDFFELGGTSLKAAVLIAQIQRRFGVRLKVTDIYEAGTGRALAARLTGQRPPTAEAPVFLIHWYPANLAREIRRHRPAVVLSYGSDSSEGWPPPVGIEALAEHYVAQMRQIRPCGPYHLVGYSVGGFVAWEMARQLGAEVGLLCVIDAAPPELRGRRRLSVWTTLRRIAGASPRVLVHKARRRVSAAVSPPRPTLRSAEERAALWQRAEHVDRLKLIDYRLDDYRMQPFGGQLLLISALPSTDYKIMFEAPLPLEQAYAYLGLIAGTHRLVEMPGNHESIVEGDLARRIADAIEGDIAAR